MFEIITLVLIFVVIHTAFKLQEINMRLKILDIRHRIMEVWARSQNNEVDFEWLYNHHFGDLYSEDYNKIVRFGRKYRLNLPLLTTEEEKERGKNNKKA